MAGCRSEINLWWRQLVESFKLNNYLKDKRTKKAETNKVIWIELVIAKCFSRNFELDEPEEEETNKVKGKIRTGVWELLKRQRSPLDHEICHSSMDEKKDL